MSKFDRLINEITAGTVKDVIGSAASKLGSAVSNVQQFASAVKTQATGGGSLSGAVGSLIDSFKKLKLKLTPISSKRAKKLIGTAVIADPVEGIFLNGVYGEIINPDPNNPSIGEFMRLYKNSTGKSIGIELIKGAEMINRYWIKLYNKGENQEYENNKKYTTWFIYKGAHAGFFEITEGSAPTRALIGENDPRKLSSKYKQSPSYAFRLTGPASGLVLVGNKTLYPTWYSAEEYKYLLSKETQSNDEDQQELKQASMQGTYQRNQ